MKFHFIEPELDLNKKIPKTASYIRKEFPLSGKVKKATAYFTACGLYKAYINGREVDHQVLLPGNTSYAHRLQYQQYDVTTYLQEGANAVAAVVGEGWYRGKGGFPPTPDEGKRLKFMCHLEIDMENGTAVTLDTDSTWRATQDGPIGENDLKAGEHYDARKELAGWTIPGFDDSKWHEVRKGQYAGALVPCEGERILEQERFSPKEILHTPDGSTVLDFGQNLCGYMEFAVTGKAGTQVRLIYGETLDENGNFTVKNLSFQTDKKTGLCDQTDCYILKEGKQSYKPTFSIRGFQYVKLVNWPEPVNKENFTSIAVYSELKPAGTFCCSNEKVNKLVQNVSWSMKSNFVDIPTDCPTRERAGWTGDIMVFSVPAIYQMDSYRFLKKWLKDVILEQGEDGRISNIVPGTGMPRMMDGAAGWSDAIVKVPWVLYQYYGKKEILELAYPAIVKHIQFMNRRRKKRKPWNLAKGKHWDYIIDTGFHWGEWLEPGSSMPSGALRAFTMPDCEVATAYFAWSTRQAAEIADVLGKAEDAKKFRQLHQNVVAAYRKEFLPDGTVHSKRQCRYVRPVALDLVDEGTKERVVSRLNQMVVENQYRIGTGFLSTPYICRVLTEHGYTQSAYGLLENEAAPGWLYEVNKGATTIWENWFGKNEKNVPTNSMNHYSPGAVVGWMYSHVAGIRPLLPGFERVLIAPNPGGSFQWVTCSYDSAAGQIVSNWRIEDGRFELEVTVPTPAEIRLPDGTKQDVEAGTWKFTCNIKE